MFKCAMVIFRMQHIKFHFAMIMKIHAHYTHTYCDKVFSHSIEKKCDHYESWS